MKRQGIAEALRDAIAEEMERDPRVFCLGEDIGVPGGWGGAFTVTLGLEKRFPDRIINTPIAELGFFGVATRSGDDGHAADRRRAVWRLPLSRERPDHQQRREDALHVGRRRSRSPMVMRAPVGATGRGSQHAQNMERYFTGVPGLKVVARLERLRRQGNAQSGRARRQSGDDLRAQALVRLEGRARRARRDRRHERHSRRRLHRAARQGRGDEKGSSGHASWAGCSCAHLALQATEPLAPKGSTPKSSTCALSRRSTTPTIGASVHKNGRVVIVEEGPKTGGVGAEIAASLCERVPGLRVARVASPDVPVPFSPRLENAYRPDVARVVAAARALCRSGGS